MPCDVIHQNKPLRLNFRGQHGDGNSCHFTNQRKIVSHVFFFIRLGWGAAMKQVSEYNKRIHFQRSLELFWSFCKYWKSSQITQLFFLLWFGYTHPCCCQATLALLLSISMCFEHFAKLLVVFFMYRNNYIKKDERSHAPRCLLMYLMPHSSYIRL